MSVYYDVLDGINQTFVTTAPTVPQFQRGACGKHRRLACSGSMRLALNRRCGPTTQHNKEILCEVAQDQYEGLEHGEENALRFFIFIFQYNCFLIDRFQDAEPRAFTGV